MQQINEMGTELSRYRTAGAPVISASARWMPILPPIWRARAVIASLFALNLVINRLVRDFGACGSGGRTPCIS